MLPAPWWKSKTIWLNLIALVLELLAVADTLPASATLKVYIPSITAALNIVLRFMTGAPIAGTQAAADANRLVQTALVMPPHASVGDLHQVVNATNEVPTPRQAAMIVDRLPEEPK